MLCVYKLPQVPILILRDNALISGAAEDKGDDEKLGKEGEEETGENNENQEPNNLEPKDEVSIPT